MNLRMKKISALNNMDNKKIKVMLGMSGGVDSSAAAIKLKEMGYEVVGLTMILKPLKYLSEQEKINLYKDVEDAKRVCDALSIPHFAPDFSELFEEKVINNFIDCYLNGRTPNPCVQCNINLKFGAMLDFALKNGCDMIATGHYAKLTKSEDGRTLLQKAPSNKDQSYFLYGLNEFQLSHSIFPIWDITKEEARALVASYNLPVANKPDSQEICFIKNNDYISFLENFGGKLPKKGNFINSEGKILGQHTGIYRYTIGQRKGLGITFGEPMYVKKIDAENNTVMLSRLEGLMSDTVYLRDVNLIAIDEVTNEIEVEAKIRYQAKPSKALLSKEDGAYKLKFYEKQKSVTPGQAAVFYIGETVIGGGTII